ncbi:hypothetical protein M2323_003302 [Rhodoblastus acidophilus]|uniref:hypothetical protein n=1 Tax=Rhodoblastus acidophilus TaxID=1074 RepID=UPI002223F481|nr:hypothetical protein [Rhodoblastus acidophilus]MCW2285391.1 hypothetical protein [Rhodoblastus acidophilus]MCW2334361.1 hypothetical protein [Rhodoblastus acidophilus]
MAKVVVLSATALLTSGSSLAPYQPRPSLHFASNGNFDEAGRFAPKDFGFNIADVASAEMLDALPDGVFGMIWAGRCEGPDARFQETVMSVIQHPKLFGFYLADDPDPSGRWRKTCPPENLRSESDWIHARRPDALTFVALMNLGDEAKPRFHPELRPENTHVDLYGISPYPCRRDWPECDFTMIDRFVDAALAAGIPNSAIVPVYQTFGGGSWTAKGGGYRMPNAAELREMLVAWRRRAPNPRFDYAYSWGTQKGDVALSVSSSLREVFKQFNGN